MNCELCNKNKATIHLTFQGLDDYACWQCFQWALEAVNQRRPIHLYVTRKVEHQAIIDAIQQRAKERRTWVASAL